MTKLILASKSPRRQQLMQMMGIDFELRTKSVEENFSPDTPVEEVPKLLAEKKARAFSSEIRANELILTADTVVIFQNEILGKPQGLSEAKQTLQKLSGQTHQVVTGVCLYSQVQSITFSDSSLVFFEQLSKGEIDYYLQVAPPMDKAGAYGIQDWIGLIAVKRMEGCYYNVMGLPIARLYQEIKKYFPNILPFQP